MTIEEALDTYLQSNTDLTELIGTRLYPKKLPQKPTLPAVVYHRISGPREHSMDGSSGLAHPRFQFDMYGRTYAAAKDVSDKMRLALDAFKGTIGGVDINGAFLEDDSDGYDDDLEIYWFQADYEIWHNE